MLFGMKPNHGFYRVFAGNTVVRQAAVQDNTALLLEALPEQEPGLTSLVLYPELCLTGADCGNLFRQQTLLNAALRELDNFLKATAALRPVFVVGLPLVVDGLIFNCAVVAQRGLPLGVVPRAGPTRMTSHQGQPIFATAAQARSTTVELAGREVPFGSDLLFESEIDSLFCFAIAIGDDITAPLSPAVNAALNGATLICNPGATPARAGLREKRTLQLRAQSAMHHLALLTNDASPTESACDNVGSGMQLLIENGRIIADGAAFQQQTHSITGDVDLQKLDFLRRENSAFTQAMAAATPMRRVKFRGSVQTLPPEGLFYAVARHPFVPREPERCEARCREVVQIQASGLAARLLQSGLKDVVLGISGGLDSTLALLTTMRAFELARLPLTGIHALTMPAFGTSRRTLNNSKALCRNLGLELEVIDISEACRLHLKNLGHDGATHDSTFENVQARERTQMLMNRANMLRGLVVGTGDLSELALGWCTYNGDHMSMYAVNSGVPKTLIVPIINWYAGRKADTKLAEVLRDIVATPVSPELLPADEDGEIAQLTEDVLGPYELHDFFLYHLMRTGAGPAKLLYLAAAAFGDDYEPTELRQWLTVFLTRFFASQFKRSCLPDGPSIGSVNLSPRVAWQMPSTADPQVWLDSI